MTTPSLAARRAARVPQWWPTEEPRASKEENPTITLIDN